ncbi:MAG: hypothetical protein C0412_08520, partial [Flavobacterium sp.]|nr:hypothetical protein [Flavobacterium sp.]
MKKHVQLKNIVFLVVMSFFNLLNNSFAQSNIEQQFKTADALFQAESYYDAITEYKRLLLFDDQKQFEHETFYKIAMSYKMGGKYDDAIQYFIKAEKSAPSQEQKFTIQIQIIRTNILRRTTDRALVLLAQLEVEAVDKSKIEEITYWRGWAYMFQDKFEKASLQFGLLNKDHELKKLCDKAVSDKYSVTFAKVISYILPGAGQIYTGEIISGLLSLGWNALFGYLTLNAFI